MNGKPKRIMIVDDDSSVVKFIEVNLKARNYEVFIAPDGKSALNNYKSYRPDLILLDIMMPNINGFEVCKQIRQFSKVPIIMLSARDGVVDKEICLNCGANDYLTKPFALKELLLKISDLLAK